MSDSSFASAASVDCEAELVDEGPNDSGQKCFEYKNNLVNMMVISPVIW